MKMFLYASGGRRCGAWHVLGPDVRPHGTLSRYTNDRCRCVACREAASEYNRIARLRRFAEGPPAYAHGTDNGYTNYGCRGPYCTEARHAVYMNKEYGVPRRTAAEIRQIVEEGEAVSRRFGLSARRPPPCGSPPTSSVWPDSSR
jgi:hypothetical protein